MAVTGARSGLGPLISSLLVVSGFAALVYQVLWVRQLTLLLGSTAQAAALAIAIFFTGLAAGGAWWGQRSATTPSALRLFGLLEVAVAATALGHFVLLDAYHTIYPTLYAWVAGNPTLDLAAKLLIATVILLPPSFLMGGTLPALGQHLVRRSDQLGRIGSRLYALNTAGSAAGALAAGFVLPTLLGFRHTYLLAVFLDFAVGTTAVALARLARPDTKRLPADAQDVGVARRTSIIVGRPAARRRALPRTVLAVAFLSGFATLAVEVLWTRLFAQVLQNSVYTYALVLTTFLVALAAGASVANWLCRLQRFSNETVLLALLVGSALATAISPWVFHAATNGLSYVGAHLGWNGYLTAVATTAAVVIFPAATIFGTVLPFLLKMVQQHAAQPGHVIGRVVAVNTTGAVLGALSAGFLMIPSIGTTRSLLAAAALYPLAILIVGLRKPAPRRAIALATATATIAAVVAIPHNVDLISLSPGGDQRLVELREGVQATVAVVDSGTSRSIRVNNYYTLGSSGARYAERDQTIIPILTHPTMPRSVFFLGMGTGITAGAATAFPIERIVVCELLDDVVDAARNHFGPWTYNLFEDARVQVYAEDGRTCLQRSPERYDLIISDLFTPWKAGTGNLYTREHYRTGRDRLNAGGRYVQWIPLYQVSERELGSIARTMDEVFNQVVLWRGDLFSSRSIVALVGHVDTEPLDAKVMVEHSRTLRPNLDPSMIESLLLRMYVGNVSESGYFADHPVNTDEHPFVEYTAPRTHRDARIGNTHFLIGEHRERLYDDLLALAPPDHDSYLTTLNRHQIDQIIAGRHYSAYVYANEHGDTQAANDAYEAFVRRADTASEPLRSPARLLLD